MSEFVSFHHTENLQVKIGESQKELSIGKLLWSEGKNVLQILSKVLSQDAKEAHKVLLAARKASPTAMAEFGKVTAGIIDILVVKRNFETMAELLDAVSNGVITDKVMKEERVQYSEACDLLRYLIDANFESLKNTLASLQAMTSSGQQESKQ